MSKEKLSYLYFPILISIFLFVNLILLQTNNYCNTTGCGITKTILNIEQYQLYLLSLFIFGIIIIFSYLYLFKNKTIFKSFINIILLTLLISETIFFSYLYIYSKEICIICFIFFSLLLINNIMIFSINKTFEYLIIVPAIFITLSILKIENKNNYVIDNTILLFNDKNQELNDIKTLLENKNIIFKENHYNQYLDIINKFELDSLPILILKHDNNIIILKSKEEIVNYLK